MKYDAERNSLHEKNRKNISTSTYLEANGARIGVYLVDHVLNKKLYIANTIIKLLNVYINTKMAISLCCLYR